MHGVLASKLDSLGSSGKYSVEGALPTSLKPSHDALLPDTPAAIGGSVAVGDAGEAESNVAQKKGFKYFNGSFLGVLQLLLDAYLLSIGTVPLGVVEF